MEISDKTYQNMTVLSILGSLLFFVFVENCSKVFSKAQLPKLLHQAPKIVRYLDLFFYRHSDNIVQPLFVLLLRERQESIILDDVVLGSGGVVGDHQASRGQHFDDRDSEMLGLHRMYGVVALLEFGQ